MRNRYRLFKRKLKKRKVYYARVLDPEGSLIKTVSTGESNRYRADDWIRDYLERQEINRVQEAEEKNHITTEKLSVGFWNPGGFFERTKAARGHQISFRHLQNCDGYTRNHVLPKWGKVRVANITTPEVNAWILDQNQKGDISPATINKVLSTLRALLEGAVLKGYISENPAAPVKPVKEDHRERGVLTDAEIAQLLSGPEIWADYRHYTMHLIAFHTGARIGEIRGLPLTNVYVDRIDILQAWEDGTGLKEPKWNSKRAVPIPEHVYNDIQRVISETDPDDLIFYSHIGKDRPLSKSVIEKQFYRALERIGISPEARKERNITVHSWRHKLNTILRAKGVPDSKIRLLTGHKNSAMTDWYTRYTAEDFTDVLNVQETILPFRKSS